MSFVWITKTDLLLIKEDSYDKSENLYKQKKITFKKIEKYHVLDTIKVMNVKKQHSTSLTFKEIEIDIGIKDNLFQEKNLKRIYK